MYLHCLYAIFLLALSTSAWSAEDEEQEGPWAGKVVFGYLATSGNTNNSSLNAAFEVSYKVEKWRHLLAAAVINATEDNATTADAVEIAWKSERNLAQHNYLFGQLDWREDRFSGYETQFSQTVGYGRRLIDTDKHKFSVEIGAGARQSELADGSKESESIVRGGLHYVWKLSETASFTQVATVEYGRENTYTESVTALSAKLVGNLALVASYTVKNNSDVPPLTEKTDTYTALSLEYLF